MRDSANRTPLHVAVFQSHDVTVEALAKAGANVDAFEDQAYDIITIAAVADDVEMVRLAHALGGNPGNVTSPYDGTALIAAAHLGHHEVVKALVDAGAPLDHVNNLGWTALIEAVILGDGGPRHIGRFGFFWRVAPKSRSSTARAGHPCSTLRCAITRRSRGSFAR